MHKYVCVHEYILICDYILYKSNLYVILNNIYNIVWLINIYVAFLKAGTKYLVKVTKGGVYFDSHLEGLLHRGQQRVLTKAAVAARTWVEQLVLSQEAERD